MDLHIRLRASIIQDGEIPAIENFRQPILTPPG
jgi:hypothetical protein